ncbi:hypothetical protein PTI98_013164 [Pleurotus ostreatus]|nr:hypothetical protein PTI98_013164 [Pleurotus ostreatus]
MPDFLRHGSRSRSRSARGAGHSTSCAWRGAGAYWDTSDNSVSLSGTNCQPNSIVAPGRPSTTGAAEAYSFTPSIPQAPLQDNDNLNPAINRGGEPLPTTQNVTAPVERLDDDHGSRDSSPGHRPNQPNPIYPRYPQRLADPGLSRVNSRRSGIDWIVPVEERKELPPRPKTLGERLQKTIDHANTECEKYAVRAKLTAYALNIAIGMQVLLGALTTAVSAATSGHSVGCVRIQILPVANLALA